MKTRNLLKLMVALLVLPMCARAQVSVMLDNNLMKENRQDFVLNGTHYFATGKTLQQNPSAALQEGEGVKVTFELQNYTGRGMCQIRIFNESFSHDVYTKDTESISIPSGIYDVISLIGREDSEGTLYNCLVIKEQINVQEGMTIVLSADMADQRIEVKNYGPNGEILKFPLGHPDYEAMEWVIDDEGDIDIIDCDYNIFLKEVGWVFGFSHMVSGEYTFNPERRTPNNLDWFINGDVSDRFLFTQTRVSMNAQTKTYYVSHFSTDNVLCGVVENNPQNYIMNQETWKYTPDGKDRAGCGSMMEVAMVYDNLFANYTALGVYNPELDKETEFPVYVNVPKQDAIDSNLELYLNQNIYDGADYNEATGQYNYDNCSVELPYFQFENGEKLYTNLGPHSNFAFTNDMMNVMTDYMGEKQMKQRLTPYPPFSFMESAKSGVFGDNCPISILMLKYRSNHGSYQAHLEPMYIGRYGETRWCDNNSWSWEATYNGEAITTIDEWNAQQEGVYGFTFRDANVEVDGLEGENITTVNYDTSREDCIPPTLTMLQFRNTNGNVTDRYSSANDGIMEMTAADFNCQFMPDYKGAIYECNPISITVEYAPYDKDVWVEMEIEEIPENYNEKGWGYFYRGSLKDVEGAGEKGWFDLRFTMVDAAGNTHVQTVSPAFRIDDKVDTGIGDNNQYTITNKQEVYDLMGRKVGNGSRLLDNGYCNKGISIVRRANGDVRKVVIK